MGALWVYVTESGSGARITNAQFGGPQGMTYFNSGDGRYQLQNIYPDQPFWADSPCHSLAYSNSDGYVRDDGSGLLSISLVKDRGWPDC